MSQFVNYGLTTVLILYLIISSQHRILNPFTTFNTYRINEVHSLKAYASIVVTLSGIANRGQRGGCVGHITSSIAKLRRTRT